MTNQQLDALLEEWSRGNKLRLDAYYYGFEHTGCLAIDRVLSAVAISGKWYHNTEDWNQVSGHGVSASELIQAAAERSAKELREMRLSEKFDAMAKNCDDGASCCEPGPAQIALRAKAVAYRDAARIAREAGL